MALQLSAAGNVSLSDVLHAWRDGPGEPQRIRNMDYAVGSMTMLFLAAYYKAYTDLYKHYKSKIKEYRHPLDRKNRYHEMRRVCYYRLRKQSCKDDPVLKPNDIPASLCTHIIVGYAHVDFNGIVYPAHPEDEDVYASITRVGVPVLLSIAGPATGGFSSMVSTRTTRLRFIRSTVGLIRRFGFSGVDLDWEFPGMGNNRYYDRRRFTVLVEEFRAYMKESKKEFLMSACVSAKYPVIYTAYDVRPLSKMLDFVNVMAYDFSYFTEQWPYTEHHSPLFPRPGEPMHLGGHNVASAIHHWTAAGMPHEKINVGIPLYARTYRLKYRQRPLMESEALGPGPGTGGRMSYREVCKHLKGGGVALMDKYTYAPYAYREDEWMGYDNVQSTILKSQWAETMGLGGVMTYAINMDDWEGACDNKTTFPIHRAIWRTIG
ncbi:chitinase-3-like protein 2 [Ornithodoros turicata]|uniref:chitinase-3-like protein 2 n=1 Tax=Ornithodoros turicata TaxID=34597 RepID=UPI003138EE01